MAFADYDFTVTPNGSQNIPASGSVVRVRSTTGQLRVSIDGGPGVKLSAGQGFRLGDGQTFRDVTVRDVSGSGATGVLFIGDAGYEDQTFSGSVTIANGTGPFTITNKTLSRTPGQASQVIAGARAVDRRYLAVQNKGAGAIWISFTLWGEPTNNGVITTSTGLKIESGQTYTVDGGFAPAGYVIAVAEFANTEITCVEG